MRGRGRADPTRQSIEVYPRGIRTAENNLSRALLSLRVTQTRLASVSATQSVPAAQPAPTLPSGLRTRPNVSDARTCVQGEGCERNTGSVAGAELAYGGPGPPKGVGQIWRIEMKF